MGLTQLLAALERDATNDIERLTAAARAEADGVTAASESRLHERRRVSLDEVDRRHRHELELALTVARRAGRRAVLEAHQRLQQRVFDDVRALLPGALGLDAYRERLPAALARALVALGEGPVVIRCTPAIRAPIDALQRPAGVSVVPDDTVGSGFLAQTPDGSVAVVDTREERLERRRPELTRWALDHLGAGA